MCAIVEVSGVGVLLQLCHEGLDHGLRRSLSPLSSQHFPSSYSLEDHCRRVAVISGFPALAQAAAMAAGENGGVAVAQA